MHGNWDFAGFYSNGYIHVCLCLYKMSEKKMEAYPKDIRPQISESNPEQTNMEYLQTRVLSLYSMTHTVWVIMSHNSL